MPDGWIGKTFHEPETDLVKRRHSVRIRFRISTDPFFTYTEHPAEIAHGQFNKTTAAKSLLSTDIYTRHVPHFADIFNCPNSTANKKAMARSANQDNAQQVWSHTDYTEHGTFVMVSTFTSLTYSFLMLPPFLDPRTEWVLGFIFMAHGGFV
ncbi:hypothetical protein CEXT_81141 [Caerostris extrusa]|uniref:Uncharacterized protein n=1 Tax=Caerostris extrusa TaxID=172846 RepID=A0AAV4SAC1_CAEEX|nr:hypothetical protein CEXT_81141 [Caerostris extrusa]